MDREDRLFTLLLKKNGLSLTRPRKKLFKIMKSGQAKSIGEITAAYPFDRSTAYRTLELFERLGIVVQVHLGWKHKYELSDAFQHHHHHLTCLKCGNITALPEDLVLEQEIARLSYTNKFKAVDHQLEIRGLCQNCR